MYTYECMSLISKHIYIYVYVFMCNFYTYREIYCTYVASSLDSNSHVGRKGNEDRRISRQTDR